ncbi:class E sortase [Georgenia ruanii]|uniref:Class E sortase n=1 Tax=Georgenia ruanii TaxID=348442 RepID=A0A7J9UXB6_9MICO|nr:class E sortase [Georgenia ruanii]MPV89268.1 class E sortase [Georgenia ruanii]
MSTVIAEPGPARSPARHRGRRPSRGARIVGVLGELLLTAGVLLGLFVVWQVWWTDVVAGREQDTVVAQLKESYAAPAVEATAQPRTDPPPTVAPVPEGQGFATLHVPRWGSDYEVAVAEGVGLRTVLNTGAAGHYPGTAMPGELGNFALAAHRQTHGAAFHGVDKLRPGDPLVVETADAWLVYRVTDSDVVTPDEVDVIAPVPGEPGAQPTARTITLTTCHPLWSVAERWITHGELTEWYPRAEGMPAELLEGN